MKTIKIEQTTSGVSVPDAMAVDWAREMIESADNYGSVILTSTEAMWLAIAALQRRNQNFEVSEIKWENGNVGSWDNQNFQPSDSWEGNTASQQLIDEVYSDF